MRKILGSSKTNELIVRCGFCALLTCIGSSSLDVLAEDTVEPSWRQGVSRWTGTHYDLPSPVVPIPTAVLPPSASWDAIADSPYTIPVDPSLLPSTKSIAVSGPGAQSNPYVRLPPPDEMTSLELTSPSDAQADDAPSTYVLPPEPISPTRRAVDPLVAPIDRVEADSQTLPAPIEAVPGTSDEAEELSPDSIGEQIVDEAVSETAPLEAEVLRWYEYPRRWMRGWNSHAELGLDGATGNSRTLAIQAGLETKRKTDTYTLSLDFDYRQASNRSTITEDNGRFNLDYDRMVVGTPWSGFGKYGMEWDKFKAFDLRLWGNAGVGYYWIRRDDATLVTRFGAGASKEIGAPNDAWIPEAVFGAEAERQLTSRQKLKAKVDYFPAWEDFGNFRLVNDVAWEILLDGSENLSLKLAATDRYDSTPQGAKKNDLYYSLLLLYKF